MDALEEESFALSSSSASDAEFDAVVGYLENIIMDDEFQLLQRNFMEKHYREFEDTEENKLTYTLIFNEYISLVEKYIEEQLLERIPGFSMAAFTTTLQHHKDEVAGDIFDMLLTFTDFLAFKEMFLDYKAPLPCRLPRSGPSSQRHPEPALSNPSSPGLAFPSSFHQWACPRRRGTLEALAHQLPWLRKGRWISLEMKL